MTETPPPEAAPAPRRANGGLGLAALVVGLLMLALSGLCTGAAVVTGGGDTSGYGPLIAIFALIIGGPVILFALGLIALGQRLRDPTTGDPPGWHRVMGWLLLIGGGLAALGIVGSTVANIVGMASFDAEGVEMIPTALMGLLFALFPAAWIGLAIWVGWVIRGPRR